MPHDFSTTWNGLVRLINNVLSLLPNVALGTVAFIVFLLGASLAKSMVRRFVGRRKTHKNLSVLLGQVAYVTALILGFLIAVSIMAPSFHASDLIKILGIGSVAIGFAFQNILQNFLAGILLLLQEPFELGDWISVTGLEGRVDDIQARATIVVTQDGLRVVIPNAVLFTNPVVVGTSGKKEGNPPGRQDESVPQSGNDHGAALQRADRTHNP
jgi:small conductance mechanosensitive channel